MDSSKLFTVTDRTAEFDPQDIQQNKAMGILAYIGPLVFVPMFAAKQSKFAQYSAEQGIMLFIAAVAISILSFIFGLIPVIGTVFSILFYLLDVGITVLMVLGIVFSAQGKAKDLPIVGQFKLIKLL